MISLRNFHVFTFEFRCYIKSLEVKKRMVNSVIRHPLYLFQVSSIYCPSCLLLVTLWKSLAKIVGPFSVLKMWSKTNIYAASVKYSIDIQILSRMPWRPVYPNLRIQRNLPYHVARFTDVVYRIILFLLDYQYCTHNFELESSL